jgi:alpha-glucosidase (family GH31 glycosyl hydrolase)
LYPGSDASFFLYEDDGKSFDYRKGEWMGVQMSWNDAQRTLNISLPDGARMLPPLRRNLEIKLEQTKRQVEFTGKPLKVQL